MSARNIYHDAVVAALKADGWTITDDPFTISYGRRQLFVDLAAERAVLAAVKNGEQIAIEIQSFLNASDIDNLHRTVGQYIIYRVLLDQLDPNRLLYIAVPNAVYIGILSEPIGQLVITKLKMKLMVFDQSSERIIQWIS
jgi:hypothetical protein